MKSPCIKVCVMDFELGLCKGCYRSMEEIERWGSMSDSERERVLAILDERKEQLGASDAAKISVPPLP